jgi:hypothetical protein
MVEPISVDYYEEVGYPKSRWEEGEFIATRRLICDWADRIALINELDTHPQNQYPYPDGPLDAVAFHTMVEGFGEQGKEEYTVDPGGDDQHIVTLATYPKARVTVKYSTIAPRYIGGGTLISEWCLPYTETHRRNGALFRWDSGSGIVVRPEEGPHQIAHGMIYVVKYHKELAVPAWVLGRLGCVNPANMGTNLLGLTFAPETLLYEPPTIRTSYTAGMLERFDITVHYKYRPTGWNTWWRTATGQYEAMYLAGRSTAYREYPLWVA